jgi:hypothetical protein
MNVPPASTNRSRMASEVASSVRLPISIAPRLSTLTSRLVAGSFPMVLYLIQNSLGNRACSKSSQRSHVALSQASEATCSKSSQRNQASEATYP